MLVGVGFGCSAAWAGTSTRLCARRHCQLLAATPQIEVLRATGRRPSEAEFEQTYARRRPGGRLVWLGDQALGGTGGIRVRALTLAGPFLAYALRLHGEEPPALWSVERLNVETGRRESFAAGPAGENQFPDQGAGVFQTAVSAEGTIVWTVGGQVTAPSVHAVLEVAAAAHAPTVLASDTTIQLKSLALAPGYVYWTDGVTPHLAPAS
jgi:hypothetical protein